MDSQGLRERWCDTRSTRQYWRPWLRSLVPRCPRRNRISQGRRFTFFWSPAVWTALALHYAATNGARRDLSHAHVTHMHALAGDTHGDAAAVSADPTESAR